jgi:hypothetical protein
MLSKKIALIFFFFMLPICGYAMSCSIQSLSYKSLAGTESFHHPICIQDSDSILSQRCYEKPHECKNEIQKKYRNRLARQAYSKMQSPIATLCENLKGQALFLSYKGQGGAVKISHVCDFDHHAIILSDDMLSKFSK